MKIVIIRHGQTFANCMNKKRDKFYTGALNNSKTDLTFKGIWQARNIKHNKFVKQMNKIYCSDLNRAIETAKIVKPNFPLILDKRLRERSLGIFEDQIIEEVLSKKEYQKYKEDNNYNKFRQDFIQKAPKGENYTDVYKRCEDFLNNLKYKESDVIGIFSHNHTIRCLFLYLLNVAPNEKIFNLNIKHCEPYVFEGKDIHNMELISHDINKMYK